MQNSSLILHKTLPDNEIHLYGALINHIRLGLGDLEWVNQVIKENEAFWLNEFQAHPLVGIKECPAIVYLNAFGNQNKTLILSKLDVIEKKQQTISLEIRRFIDKVFCKFNKLCSSFLNERAYIFAREPMAWALEIEKNINDLNLELCLAKKPFEAFDFKRWKNNIESIFEKTDALE